MIAAAGLVAALEVPAIGELHCARASAASVSKVADEHLRDMGDHFEFVLSRYNRTSVHDPVRYPAAGGAAWFQAHIGGAANGEAIAYNPSTRLLARCIRMDTAESIEVARVRRAPPAYVPRRSFVFSTQRGLRVGSTVADIERVYGRTAPLHTVQGLAYAFERDIQFPASNLPYTVRTVFFVRNGHVVAVVRFAGV